MITADDRPVLITGGAGFIGCNIADRLMDEGHEVIVYDSLARPGVERNLAWLEEKHGRKVTPVIADIADTAMLREVVGDAQAVFHMAAQVAVTTSLDDPRQDFEVNALGTFNLLESARRCAVPPPVIFASTNKVYGGLDDVPFHKRDDAYQPTDEAIATHGISEDRSLDFHTPYGCSKGAADQYVLDYGRSFGLQTAVLRMSCIYGQRQMGTEDQGWVAHFLIRALQGQTITLFGDGCQARDILDVRDAVDAYLAILRNIASVRGRAFNLGGGPSNAVSLRQIIDQIGDHLGRPLDVAFDDWRAGDQRYFVADTRALQKAVDWQPRVQWREGVAALTRWLTDEKQRLASPPLLRVEEKIA